MTVIIDGTNGVQSVGGSATITSFTAIGDTNTGIFFPAADTIAFAEGGVEVARFDSSGNLGLGVTPVTQNGGRIVEVGTANGNIFRGGGLNDTNVESNIYFNSGFKYAGNGFGSRYSQNSGVHQWWIAPNNTSGAGANATLTQAMTLDASGNLALGTTSSLSSLYRFTLVGGRVNFASASDGLNLYLQYNNSTNGVFLGSPAASTFAINTFDGTNVTERARITSGGDLLVGTTTSGGRLRVVSASGIGQYIDGATLALSLTNDDLNHYSIQMQSKSSSTATHYCIGFTNSVGTIVGSITHDNANTTYSTSSDRRLKENIVPAPSASSVIDAIEVVSHDWKVGGHTRYGMIAQDLYTVAPEAVSVGDADDVEELKQPWGVDYSKLVPMLVKEIQSLRARVAALEAK